MSVFSVTDLGRFRRCRRMWDYSSNARQNLTGIGSGPEPLELGSLIHRALADWIVEWNEKPRDFPEGHLGQIFLNVAAERQKEITKSFEEVHGMSVGSEQLASLHNVVMLGFHMMNNYQAYHIQPLPKHMRFASPEQEVLIPVPGTEHYCEDCVRWAQENDRMNVYSDTVSLVKQPGCNSCNGTGTAVHYLSATLDGLIQDEKDRFLVLENKTYENRPKLIDLYSNDQFTLYTWVVRELNIGKVVGICYNGLWKREKPPKYMQREKRAGIMSDLFIRKVIYKEDAELDERGKWLAAEINEMANNPVLYPNIPWQGCSSDCSFQDPCRMQQLGEDPTALIRMKYIQREIIRGGKGGTI